MPEASPTLPAAPDLLIVSDETWPQLQRLKDALERRGLQGELVAPGALALRAGAGVPYIRRLDPGLVNPSYVAWIVSHPSLRDRSINAPASVRLAEWAPLASHAFREHRVPQLQRVWCVNDHDLRRAAHDLRFPVVVEGTVSHRRAFAATEPELPAAVEAVTSGPVGEARGVLVEQWLQHAAATISVLVVEGRPAGFAFARGSDLTCVQPRRIQDVAVQAVAALGGRIMAAIVVADRDGNTYVRRVDPAPDFARFGQDACETVTSAIALQLRGLRAAHGPRGHRARRRRRAGPVAQPEPAASARPARRSRRRSRP